MPKFPLKTIVDNSVDWIMVVFGPYLDSFSDNVDVMISGFHATLAFVPWWLIIGITAFLAYFASGRKLAVGSALGLYFIFNLGLWPAFLDTIVLVLISAFVSIIIGVPLGIICGKSDGIHKIISPILDFMQTMPSFVYLIPALLFFGLGNFAAVFATVIFAMPPIIRLTDLGIRQVPVDLVEVGEAFGTPPLQLLWKIQLPVAMPTIMAGLNQTMMLSLSMVVITAMIGAGGLGAGVLYAIGQLEIGMGFENGVAVVILAIILDRLTQAVGQRSNRIKG